MAMAELMGRLAAERIENPTDDLTTALVNSEVDGEKLTHQEIASFFILLLVAGNETTRTAIAQGLLALSENPEQRAAWMADPSMDKSAVEEIVRYVSPVTWMRRTATQDGEVNGHSFKEGDKFLLFYDAANRDPEVVREPARAGPRPHAEQPRRLRRARAALLPGRAPGPARARGDLPPAVRDLPRPGDHRRARPAALLVRQRPQAAAGAADGRAMSRVQVDRERCVASGVCESLAPGRLRDRRRRRPPGAPGGARGRRPRRRPRRRPVLPRAGARTGRMIEAAARG